MDPADKPALLQIYMNPFALRRSHSDRLEGSPSYAARAPEHANRNMQRLFVRLSWCRRRCLTKRQTPDFTFRIIILFHIHYRCTGLAIPQSKLSQIYARNIFHCLNIIFDRYRLAIMNLSPKQRQHYKHLYVKSKIFIV